MHTRSAVRVGSYGAPHPRGANVARRTPKATLVRPRHPGAAPAPEQARQQEPAGRLPRNLLMARNPRLDGREGRIVHQGGPVTMGAGQHGRLGPFVNPPDVDGSTQCRADAAVLQVPVPTRRRRKGNDPPRHGMAALAVRGPLEGFPNVGRGDRVQVQHARGRTLPPLFVSRGPPDVAPRCPARWLPALAGQMVTGR